MMKFATRLKVTANVAAGVISTLTLGAAVLGCRTLQQAIDAGTAANDATAIKVGDTGVPFMVENSSTGDWEEAYYTIASGTVITKGAIIASSNAGAAVNFPAGTVSVFSAPPGGFLRKVVTTDDGVALSSLPTLNPSSLPSATALGSYLLGPLVDPLTGLNYTIAVSALMGAFTSTPAQQITVGTIASQVAGTAFSVTGTYANGAPTGLEYSINGGASWTAAASPTISGGNYTITGVTILTANNSQTVMVRDATTKVSGTSPAFLVTAAPYIMTNTPNSQVVNVTFQVTGWYYNYMPTAFDYRFSDDAASVWTQATSGVSITGGAFSFNVTCSTTNTTNRTITVRDRTTNTIVATSAVFSVAAGAPTVTGVVINQTNPTVIGGQTLQLTATTSGANNPSQAGTWTLLSGPGSVNATTGLYTPGPAAATAGTAQVKFVPQQDTSYSATVTITIPAQTISVTNPGTVYVGTPYTLSGTWTGLQPTALEFQFADNGGAMSAWAAFTNTPTISANGTWSVQVTPSSSSTSRIVSVRDATTLVAGSSTAYVVNTASQTIGVITPATQTAYRAYTLSGTWTGTQPTTLEYRTTDNGGTPSAWATLTGATINANGTWSASVTPTTYAASRVMSVRDASTLFSGSSNAYVVLSMAQAYKITNTNGASMLESTTNATLSSPDWSGAPSSNIRVNLRDAGGVSISASSHAKIVFGLYNDPNCPATFNGGFPVNANGCTNVSSHTNAIATCSALPSWTPGGATNQSNYGTFQTATSMNIWFGSGNQAVSGPTTQGSNVAFKAWVMFIDGSFGVDDNGTGTALKYQLTVP